MNHPFLHRLTVFMATIPILVSLSCSKKEDSGNQEILLALVQSGQVAGVRVEGTEVSSCHLSSDTTARVNCIEVHASETNYLVPFQTSCPTQGGVYHSDTVCSELGYSQCTRVENPPIQTVLAYFECCKLDSCKTE